MASLRHFNPGQPFEGWRGNMDFVGDGQFAEVFASEMPDGRKCALKVYNSGESSSFDNEQRVYAAIAPKDGERMQHIVNLLGFSSIIQFDTVKFKSYLHPVSIFELCGESLEDLMDILGGGIDFKPLRRIMREVTEGLNYLHKLGVIHTDIKPSNIYLTAPNAEITDDTLHVKIGDLGSAAIHPNYFGRIVGTIGVCSPEILVGAKYDSSADIWSLGCLCFELATGEPLFETPSSSSESGDDKEMDSGEFAAWDSRSSGASSSSSYNEEDDEVKGFVLNEMVKLLGPFPRSFAKIADGLVTPHGVVRVPTIGGSKVSAVGIKRRLEECELPAEITEWCNYLMSGCLKYAPKARVTSDVLMADEKIWREDGDFSAP